MDRKLSVLVWGLSAALSGVVTVDACTYTLPTTSVDHDRNSTSGSFVVVTTSACQWTARSNDYWIHTGTSSVGLGSVIYSIDANPNPGLRVGSINVEGEIFTIRQGGSGCYATFSPTVAKHPPGSTAGSFALKTGSSCTWAATTVFTWIHTTSSGTGSGTVNYSLDAFPGPGTRKGWITVLEDEFTIEQTGESERPAVQGIADQKLEPNTPSNPIPITLTGAFGDVARVSVTPTSSNPDLIPDANIFLGGSGAYRVIVIAPAPNCYGYARITVSAVEPDGPTASTSFLVTVGSKPPPMFHLSGLGWNAQRQFQSLISSQPGTAVTVQGSTDLRNWTDVGYLPNPTGEIIYTDPASLSTAPSKYYRVKAQ